MSKEFPIVERLGGRQAVMEILRARGVEVGSVATIRMWSTRQRCQIPGKAMNALMDYCDDERIAYDGSDFRLPERKPEETAA